MKFTETAIWQNLVQNGQLPKVEVETYVANDTIVKLTVAVISIIVVTILMLKLSKSR